MLAPAFVDPHVHLRTPGREDEETIASGTEAAAAGGYCAILAMPNTEPVVDSAAVLASLAEKARAEAIVPVGFMAAISKGQQGGELTEMGELADAGAAGFTDDGRPVVVTGPDAPRAPVQPGRGPPRRRPLRGAHAHARRPDARGRRLGRARLRGLAVGRRERHGRARPVHRRLRAAAAPPHASLGARVGRGALARAGGRRAGDGRGHAAPPLPDRRGRPLARLEREDEPAAALRGRPRGARRRPARRHDLRRRHRPRAACAAGEGRAVRGGAVRRHGAGDGVRGAQYVPRRAGPAHPRDAARAHVGRRRRARSASSRRASPSARPRTSSCSTPRPPGA